MSVAARHSIRTRLTLWYVAVLAVLLVIFAAIVFVFQYVTLTRQMIHDEVQDVATVEGLLYMDAAGHMQLRQDYFTRPESHLLIDRMMEVRDLSGAVVFRSDTLADQSLGGSLSPKEGDGSFNDRVVRLSDGHYVLSISHIHGIGGKDYVIRLAYSMTPLRQRMVQFLLLLLLALAVTVALASVTGQTIARRALRPLEEMAARAEGISANNLHDRLTVPTPADELGTLAAVFNSLLERLEQAFAQLQRFTADAAHELRTPLASLRAVGEVTLGAERSPEAYRDAISSILEETSRLNQTIDSLLLLARAETPDATQLQTFTIGPLMAEVIGVMSVLAEERSIEIVCAENHLEQCQVHGDRALLRVAFLNIVHNAIKFSPDGGAVHCTFESVDERLRVIVADQGPGVEAEDVDRVFDRFYTSAKRETHSKSGTGLGLSIAKLVVERAGGSLQFDPAALEGARCILELPARR